jgi:hypothetical protein
VQARWRCQKTGFDASDDWIYIGDKKFVEAPRAEPRDLLIGR